MWLTVPEVVPVGVVEIDSVPVQDSVADALCCCVADCVCVMETEVACDFERVRCLVFVFVSEVDTVFVSDVDLDSVTSYVSVRDCVKDSVGTDVKVCDIVKVRDWLTLSDTVRLSVTVFVSDVDEVSLEDGVELWDSSAVGDCVLERRSENVVLYKFELFDPDNVGLVRLTRR